MITTICPLDSPQLSTTLKEESHRDPASSMATVWQGRPQENPAPPPGPTHPFPSSPGGGGAPWFGEGWLGWG